MGIIKTALAATGLYYLGTASGVVAPGTATRLAREGTAKVKSLAGGQANYGGYSNGYVEYDGHGQAAFGQADFDGEDCGCGG